MYRVNNTKLLISGNVNFMDTSNIKNAKDYIDFENIAGKLKGVVHDAAGYAEISSVILLTVFILCVLVITIKAFRESKIEKLRWNKVSNHTVLWDRDGTNEIIPLEADEILVGRHGSSDIRFEDMSVSRYHAVLTVSNGIWSVIDLGSKSGTYVNGHRVEKAVLHFNDELRFGAKCVIVKKTRGDV